MYRRGKREGSSHADKGTVRLPEMKDCFNNFDHRDGDMQSGAALMMDRFGGYRLTSGSICITVSYI